MQINEAVPQVGLSFLDLKLETSLANSHNLQGKFTMMRLDEKVRSNMKTRNFLEWQEKKDKMEKFPI